MSSSFGDIFKITTWGESHGKGLGVVVDGCPSKISLSEKDIQAELDRRKPGQSTISTPRKEDDKIEILSGIFEGKTTGTPISMIVFNTDQRPKSYDRIKEIFRPGHADFTYFMKYGIRDYRGGGRSSGRETIARVAGGAVAKKVLDSIGIKIIAYTRSIGGIELTKSPITIDSKANINIDYNQISFIESNTVRTTDASVAREMESLILSVKKENTSIGGVVESVVLNVPAGLGDPVFDKLDADIAKAIMSIGSVKGIEIGDGFGLSSLRGEESNDCFFNVNGKIVTNTNRCGGILGGISNGMPIVIRAAIKPTPSIGIEQPSVNIKGEEVIISTKGRHDPCIVPRIIPVIEAMMALVICDHYLKHRKVINI
jgi:chorismate synthase